MLDKNKVKLFWDNRASTYLKCSFESIANLEQDSENLKLKIKLETEKVTSYLGSVCGKSILDLGAGVGQWAFRFLDAGAQSVTAVEYSEPLVEIAKIEAIRRGVNNLTYYCSPAETFCSEKKYDIVFISGLFVYLNDCQANTLVKNIVQACHNKTIIILRDGTGVPKRYEINDRMSEHLNTKYSAVYRTRQDYIELFEKQNFKLILDENVFDENCQLNKYTQTRLRIYRFNLIG